MPVIAVLGKWRQKDQPWLFSEFKDRLVHEETLSLKAGEGDEGASSSIFRIHDTSICY